jgi:hypothetical protein
MLEEIQKKGKDVNFAEVFGSSDDGDELVEEHVEKMGTELYAMLSLLVSGEAMTVVRGVMTGQIEHPFRPQDACESAHLHVGGDEPEEGQGRAAACGSSGGLGV